MVIWFDILSVVDSVSKYLESKDMLVDVAIDEVKRLTNFFEEYKETGFTQAMTVAKGIATEMEIDYVFNETCKTHRKNHAENVNESSPESVEESFRIHYFLHIVDQVIGLLKRIMFEQFQAYEDVFGFLFSSEKLNSLDDNHLKSCCGHLEFSLKHGKSCDVDGNDLFEEQKFLRGNLPKEKMTALEILNFIKELGLPNACIAYRILLTLPVTLASTENSFSKLKLLKSYLQLPISQEKLDGRDLISVENDLLENIDYEKFINDVATKIAIRNASH
ncbi:zinc finger MYM-type protein 1-like [Prunus dulcis]|uniref:zinc finger MYM-type protein 1-like n=1 Tax=Prunus dulcis TaxID=3755 RepID=UPI001482CC69|nr:zinc finger MYM-type protein 1-like [Prunus dulcis]